MTGTTTNGVSLLPSEYLGTNGNQIVDQNGNNVRIASGGCLAGSCNLQTQQTGTGRFNTIQTRSATD